MAQKHPIVRMGRRAAADAQAEAWECWERINAAHNDNRQLTLRAVRLEEWLEVYEHSEPGPVRALAVERLEHLLGIHEESD
jgi:hypothetical protein